MKTDNSPAAVTRRILAERFPACFMSQGAIKRPLAIGIREQIYEAAPDLEKPIVAWALRSYINGPKYLLTMVEGAQRVNLDGSPATLVTLDHQRFAELKNTQITALWAKKRAERLAKKASRKVCNLRKAA